VDLKFIARMLTLRYDPMKQSVREPLTISDFAPQSADNIDREIIRIMRQELCDRRDAMKFNHLSMSLGGGIDSTLTLAMIRSTLPEVKIKCISMGFGDEDDEVGYAREIARIHDADFCELIKYDVLSELPRLISIVNEPKWNLYHYYALENGSKYGKVFYTGDGADEIFGGYTFRYDKFLSSLSTQLSHWSERVKIYLSCHDRDWIPDQVTMFGSRINFSWEEIYEILRPYFDNNLPPLDQVFLADFNGKLLHDWLPANTAFEKTLNVKIESLFLTNTMTSFATHIPWSLKYDPVSKIGKMAIRRLVDPKIYDKIIHAKKGFSVNLASLWSRNAKDIVKRYVNQESEIVRNKIVNSRWLEKTYNEILKNANPDIRYISKMLGLLALEVWYRLFITKSLRSSHNL
jgi:asparagine synthase (glutamine-hydrolysing)